MCLESHDVTEGVRDRLRGKDDMLATQPAPMSFSFVALICTNPDGTYASCCALCEQPLTVPIFATSHFIGDESHDLWRFSDAAMHWKCYARWPEQRRFAAMYFDSVARYLELEPTRDFWPTLLKTPDVLVRYGVAVNEVSVLLRASGTDLRVLREDWASWLAGRWREWCNHELEVRAVEEVLGELRTVELPA